MISITIYRDKNGVKRVLSEGHAGYDDAGKDIVCAAVSMLFINALNSIEVFCHDRYIDNNISPGVIDRSFPEGLSHDGALLMDSMILGLQETKKQYGSKYITLAIKEV
jgi:uncharacterized protein YsxB (DUF464 family)